MWNHFETRLNAVQKDHDLAWLEAARTAEKEERAAYLSEGMELGLIPDLTLHHLDYDRWIIRIHDAPEYTFRVLVIEDAYHVRFLDPQTLYLRSRLDRAELKERIEILFTH